jgi:hypothetical protein
MTGPEVRQMLADVVVPALPPEWTVYPGPPDVISLPAAVVRGRDPYRTDETWCAVKYHLDVELLESRSTSVEGFDELDRLADVVLDALKADATLPGLAYQSTGLGSGPPIGGVETYAARLSIELTLTP